MSNHLHIAVMCEKKKEIEFISTKLVEYLIENQPARLVKDGGIWYLSSANRVMILRNMDYTLLKYQTESSSIDVSNRTGHVTLTKKAKQAYVKHISDTYQDDPGHQRNLDYMELCSKRREDELRARIERSYIRVVLAKFKNKFIKLLEK